MTVRVEGRKQVFAKRTGESDRHILLKALVFALYLPIYPALAVERSIGHRYTPDLVALGNEGTPVFWAECGEIGSAKLARLVQRFPSTHLVIAKLASDLTPWARIIEQAHPQHRAAPVELLGFDASAWGALNEHGSIDLKAVQMQRIVFSGEGLGTPSPQPAPSLEFF